MTMLPTGSLSRNLFEITSRALSPVPSTIWRLCRLEETLTACEVTETDQNDVVVEQDVERCVDVSIPSSMIFDYK